MNVPFQFGYASKNVTPARPCRMAGYGRKEPSSSVLDPLEVNACAFQIDTTTFVLAEIDSMMLSPEFCRAAKAAISQQTGVDALNITIACVHTHSAPSYFKHAFEDVPVEEELTRDLLCSVVSTCIEAFNARRPASVSLETMQVEGLYGNRNVKDGPEDKTVSTFTATDSEGDVIAKIVALSAHPTILNGSSLALSADLIGQLRIRLREHFDCPVMCVNGTCGDVSTRFYRQGSGVEELMRTADELAGQVISKNEAMALELKRPFFGELQMPTTYDAATDPDWASITERLEADSSPMSKFLLDRQQVKKDMGRVDITLISQYLVCGNLIFITMPGDTCSQFGLDFKRAFPDHHVVVVGYANTYSNYLVPREDYGKYFETFNARTARGEPDRFVTQIIGSIKALV